MKPSFKQYSRILAGILVFALLIVPSIALAAVGDLDPSFGTGGIVTTAIGGGHDLVGSEAIQSDGKIVVAGTSHNGTDNDFAVVRYNTDGSLDTSFDTDGKVTTDFGGNDNGSAVAIQTDGKIVVAGSSNYPGNFDFAVARYNSDGSLDTTFDTDGLVTTNVDILHDPAYAVAIQSDGKIVVAGYGRIRPLQPVNNDFVVMRYNTDGSLDTTFDTDGMVVTNIGGGQDQAYGVALQSDGKIVVVGYSNVGSNYDLVLVRYNTDGSLDNGFDTDGIVLTAFRDKDDFGYGLAIQSDGKIVVTGYSSILTVGNHDDFILARYNTDGSLDTGFGTDGKVVTDLALRNDHGSSVAISADGKIFVAGSSQNAANYDFGLVSYNADGSLNTDFSTDGIVITPIGSINDLAQAVAIQSDGSIVVAGNAHNGTDNDFALARYIGEINLAPTMDPMSDGNKLVGESFTHDGTFVDPDSTSWKGTVDYGDGGGPINLPLVGTSFSLAHTYMDAGVFTITVTIEDDGGKIGSDAMDMTVFKSADLEVSQSISNFFIDTIFTINVSNNGPHSAEGAAVSVTFPVELTNVNWTCVGAGGATCAASGSGNAINDTLASLPSGGEVTYTVHTFVSQYLAYTNSAGITAPSDVIDPDLTNNNSEQTTKYILIIPVILVNAAP